MSHHQDHSTGVIKSFTTTATLSFFIIFLLLVLMSGCHGDYHPVSEGSHTNSTHQVEHTPEHH